MWGAENKSIKTLAIESTKQEKKQSQYAFATISIEVGQDFHRTLLFFRKGTASSINPQFGIPVILELDL
jgi:hypothetical protein